jgi:CRISPR/Cas system-associated endonuclease/helicase Cas3
MLYVQALKLSARLENVNQALKIELTSFNFEACQLGVSTAVLIFIELHVY